MSRYGDYLKQYQPVVYKSFLNSLKYDKMPHAILLVGENGTPVKETAVYLAKSLLCDSPDPLACEECRTCLRVDHLSYTDFVMLDGTDSIKKEDVQDLMNQFSKTPLESKGKLVYVINLVENLNDRTINSLLKFLEEPQDNTYAILTTANEAKVLPTIISRCVKMRLIMVPRREIVRQVLDLGVALEDAEILSAFTSSPESIRIQSQDEDYIITKKLFEDTLDLLSRPRNAAILAFEDKIISSNIKKNGAKYFLDMLSLAFKDMVAIQNKQTPSLSQYAKILEPLARTLPHIALSLEEILRVRSELDLNIDITLLLEHVIIFLTNQENDDER